MAAVVERRVTFTLNADEIYKNAVRVETNREARKARCEDWEDKAVLFYRPQASLVGDLYMAYPREGWVWPAFWAHDNELRKDAHSLDEMFHETVRPTHDYIVSCVRLPTKVKVAALEADVLEVKSYGGAFVVRCERGKGCQLLRNRTWEG